MPIKYERDDERRLLTVAINDPFSVEDILSAIERQMAEDTWEYAMLYDMRATAHLSTVIQARRITARVQALSGGRARGPVGLMISPRPEQVLEGVEFVRLTAGIVTLELLLTAMQVDNWLARNAPRRKIEGP
jgi:hypothetical protein